jgi:transcriptional regulator with XRE-family HTH domain
VDLSTAVVDEVRRRLAERNMSQSALARAAGMPPTLVHRAMAGDRRLDLDEFGAIAGALRLTPEYLLRKAILNAPPDE